MQPTGLDWTLATGALIGSLFVIGTILLAFAGKSIPAEIANGDLAVIAFFFTKGAVQAVRTILPPKKGENPPEEPKA